MTKTMNWQVALSENRDFNHMHTSILIYLFALHTVTEAIDSLNSMVAWN